MTRRAPVRMAWLLGAVGAAITAACSNSTTPHQPAPCPAYSGGLSPGDTLYGVYRLVSYCIDTLPAYGPPADTGHVTLKRATSADSVTAVFAPQGQQPLNIAGTYTRSGTDSIHLSGQASTPLGLLPVQLAGALVLRHDTLSLSGRLTGTGSARPLSFVGTRSRP